MDRALFLSNDEKHFNLNCKHLRNKNTLQEGCGLSSQLKIGVKVLNMLPKMFLWSVLVHAGEQDQTWTVLENHVQEILRIWSQCFLFGSFKSLRKKAWQKKQSTNRSSMIPETWPKAGFPVRKHSPFFCVDALSDTKKHSFWQLLKSPWEFSHLSFSKERFRKAI